MKKKFLYFLFFIILFIIILIGYQSCFGSKFVGNKSSKVLHFKTCDFAKEIIFRNRVNYRSIEAVLKNGYNVCDKCIDVKR